MPSPLDIARMVPSGLKATDSTELTPVRLDQTTLWAGQSQTRARESWPPVATKRPSGLNAAL